VSSITLKSGSTATTGIGEAAPSSLPLPFGGYAWARPSSEDAEARRSLEPR
jgi:hypothetical protein